MSTDEEESDIKRLSEEELNKSRAGKLGRFPSPDLYEPEDEEAEDKEEGSPDQTEDQSASQRDDEES